jgi:hypothetical protein
MGRGTKPSRHFFRPPLAPWERTMRGSATRSGACVDPLGKLISIMTEIIGMMESTRRITTTTGGST